MGDEPFEFGIVTLPSEKRPRITSRHQRRGNDRASCYDSDFCNNDLTRQIGAMVLEAETDFENRHVKKPKRSASQLLSTECSSIKEVEQGSSTDKTLGQSRIIYPAYPPRTHSNYFAERPKHNISMMMCLR